MEFNEENLSNYMDDTWKIALVHRKLNNQPILIEAKSSYELNIEKDKVKEFLNNEWAKVEMKHQMKQKYDEWANERENIWEIALNEAQSLTWEKRYVPYPRFSTNYIKYDKKFRPRVFLNTNGQESVYEPTFPEEKKMKEFFYTMIGNYEKVYSLNQEYLKEYQHYQENIRRYKRLRQEQKIWDKEYPQKANPKLRKYYLMNPLLIQEQVHKILAISTSCNRYIKQPDYNRKNFYYNVKNQKLSLRYYLPSIESLENLLKEPNYEILKWEKSKKEEERIHLIWNQLILIAISEQFKADKLNLIDSIFILGYVKIRSSINGNIEWREVKKLELFRKKFDTFNLNELHANDCVEYYIEEYSKQMKNKENKEVKEDLSAIKNTMVDISYSLEDIESSSTTHIENLNNNDGGVVNFKK